MRYVCKCTSDLIFILRMPGVIIWPQDPLGERSPNLELILHFVKIVHNWLNLRSEKTSMQVSKYVSTLHTYISTIVHMYILSKKVRFEICKKTK